MKRMSYLSRSQRMVGQECSSTGVWGNCERALLTIGLRYVMSPRRQSPICSPVDPSVQVLDLAIEVCLIVLPCQPIHTRCGISPEGEECHPAEFNADMVVERGEPVLLT